jgi:acetolactate synthase I/II/III large subunit
MTVADYIFDYLSHYVDTVFFLPGGGCSFLVDALGRSTLKPIAMLHEQGAGYAAVGYAMHRGLGVCLVTSGPGVTNALTPCLAAWMDSLPVVFISGQVRLEKMANPGQRFNGVQESPTIALVTPITKAQILIEHPQAIPNIMRSMIDCAKSGRPGPVWMDIPQNIQGAEFENV